MPYHPMTSEEVHQFLTASPSRPGLVATVRADGRPHVAPVWFDLDADGTIVFNTGDSTVKGRNLRREGRATLCVEDPQPPYSFVLVEGPITLVDDLDQVRPWAGRIGARYMGEARTQEFAERNGLPGELLVRLMLEKVTSAAELAD